MVTPLFRPVVGRKPTRFHSFHTFADPGVPPSFSGAFRDNILQFLQRCAEPEDYTFEGMPIWSTFLVYDSRGIVLPLYTVEENVKHSNTPFCDYCRCSGWSHHFVSKRKYHFIIPGNDSWNGPLVDGAFELQSHLLHGLIHGNGFGHLICINGIEGGSKYIPGRDIMDFWDRICTALHVRKITLEDLSKKDKMDLRLLYGVAYGNSWFSRWGYKFFHGSFGVKEYNFDRAMDVLSSLELDQAIEDFAATDKWMQIKQIVHHYREMSSASLVTLRDLFGYLLTSKPTTTTIMPTAASFPRRCSLKLSKTAVSSRGKPPAKCRKFSSVVANLDSRWPARRLETTAQVIVEALKRKRDQSCCLGGGMTRQEVRDAARLHIGDTGLIDHVLKVMNNVVLGNCVVERSVNRSTKVLEYVIRESRDEEYAIPAAFTGRGDASSDLDYLYRNVLLQHPDPDKAMASQIILNSKRYMKEWPFRDEDDDLLRFICRLTSSCFRFDGDVFAQVPPSEHVAVPLYSTVGDLKVAVRKALQDTYCVMEKAEAVEILGTEEMQEDEVIFGICESGEEIWVRVLGLDTTGDGGGGGGGGRLLVYEAGTEKWSVECRCGAKDDDGERMMSCDVCETWQHTRCSGIEDHEPVPRLFVCEACCSSLAPATENRFEDGFPTPFFPQLTC